MRILTYLIISIAPIAAIANSVPVIKDVDIERTNSKIVVEYSALDTDGDSLSFRLAFGGKEIDLNGDGVRTSIGRIEIDNEIVEEPYLPPHLLAFDGVGYGGEYIEVEPARDARASVSRFEITNLEFSAFVEIGGYESEIFWIVDDGSITGTKLGWMYQGKFGWLCPQGWSYFDDPPWKSDTISNGPFDPVVGVSWWECWAYCRWAGLDITTEYEWRAAANLYIENADSIEGNFAGESDGFACVAPTGSFPTSDFADIAGNVWEWLNDVRDVVNYAEFTCAKRAFIGGGWDSGYGSFPDRTHSQCPLRRRPDVGFRTAFDPDSIK